MALMARRFASVWLLWSSSCDAEPLNLNRLICLGYLRGNYDHFNTGRSLRSLAGKRHRLLGKT